MKSTYLQLQALLQMYVICAVGTMLLRRRSGASHDNALEDNQSCVAVRRYFRHALFIPVVGVGKRGAYLLVHDDLPRQHSFGTTLRFTGPVPADSRQ